MSISLRFKPTALLLAAIGVGLAATPVLAGNAADKSLQNAQQQLNKQTMERGFSAPDPAAVETYIRDAMKGNLAPRRQPPSYWRNGYTCDDALQYSHQDYMDCMYYHRHYGRYW